MRKSAELPWLLGFVVLSAATSLATTGLSLVSTKTALWPLILLNWVFFLPALYLTFGPALFRPRLRGPATKPDPQRFRMCRIALGAFMLAGLIVPFSDARII
ncbi:MAG TPA: hypothetical protein VI168_04070 [Croceibacterium sp.]